MGTLTGANLITRAQDTLQDTTSVRWPEAELLRYINDAQREIVNFRPESSADHANVQLATGTEQTIPDVGLRLIKVVRNMSATGSSATGAKAIRLVDINILTAQEPDWHDPTVTGDATHGTIVKHYVFDEDDPRKYYVYPGVAGNAYVEIVFSRTPTDLANTSATIYIDDIYGNAIVDYVLYNTDAISDIRQTTQTHGMSYHVFLDFAAREENDGQSPLTNRIGLLAESFNVQTTKSRPTFPVPGTAIVTGESKTLSIDLAAASKTFSVSGVITDQLLVRKFPSNVSKMQETNPLSASGYPGKDGEEVARMFTAQEIAQLLHSSLDSSIAQPYQNITKMAVLIPTRVGYDYNYHSGVDANTPVEHLPLIPFSFKARYQDNLRTITLDQSPFFTPSHSSSTVSHAIVLQSITTDFVPGQPFMTFSMNGEFIFDTLGTARDVFDDIEGSTT